MSENSSSSRPPHRPTKNQQTDLDGLLGSPPLKKTNIRVTSATAPAAAPATS